MLTITVRRFSYEELKTRLKPEHRIVIVSCDACAKLSNGLGGEVGLNNLADKLCADGFNVTRRQLLSNACSPDLVMECFDVETTRELFKEADVVIPLACEAGETRLGDAMENLPVLSVAKTLGKGTFSPETGVRLTEPIEDLGLKIGDPEGMPIAEAADRLGLYAGSF